MESTRFDQLAKLFGERLSRRGAIVWAVRGAAVSGLLAPHNVEAKKKKTCGKPRKKCKINPNSKKKKCVNLKTSGLNCGRCGNRCGAGLVCTNGVCGCAAGRAMCPATPGVCVDLQTDAINCGTCGNDCSPSQLCSGGVCICKPGLTDECFPGTGKCLDLNTSFSFCGSCTTPCTGAQTCVGGVCTG